MISRAGIGHQEGVRRSRAAILVAVAIVLIGVAECRSAAACAARWHHLAMARTTAAIAAATAATAIAFAASAIVGLRRERQCRHAWDVYATR